MDEKPFAKVHFIILGTVAIDDYFQEDFQILCIRKNTPQDCVGRTQHRE